MLRSVKQLHGDKLGAVDGEIGHVKDFYFDDQNWAVRYVVADTGSWLSGRLVLLSPVALGSLAKDGKVLEVKLTRKQIEDSPSIESHRPVSRVYEEEYYRYYGWPSYWEGGSVWGGSAFPGALWGTGAFPMGPPVEMPPAADDPKPRGEDEDAHLRSAEEMIGYDIEATDGAVGHVSDFLMDDTTWTIQQFVVDTGSWLSGKKILIAPHEITQVLWDDSRVQVARVKLAIENAPAYHAE